MYECKKIDRKKRREEHTLPSNTPIPQYPNPFPYLIVHTLKIPAIAIAPFMLLLPFVHVCILACVNEPVHDRPLGDRGRMNPRAACQRDSSFLEDGVLDSMVQAGGEEVDEFNTVELLISSDRLPHN